MNLESFEYIFNDFKKLTKSILLLLASLSTHYIWGGIDAISDCGQETLRTSCDPAANSQSIVAPGIAQQCTIQINNAVKQCTAGRAQLNGTALNFGGAGLAPPVNADIGGLAGSGTSINAVDLFKGCVSTLKTAQQPCAKIPACLTLVNNLSYTCTENIPGASAAAGQGGQVAKAADALKSNWKPLLIGAAVGAGAMALMGGKKGGDGNSTPPPAPKPADKLPEIKLNGSTTSAAPAPSVVYYPPSNNNGSLGNPAVTGSTTSTSTPADTVKVAGITPSTSFASGQGSSISPDTSSRTISSSGAAAPASISSGGTGSTDSGGGVGGGGSDSASLVDTSGKSAGGGGSFSGGMDGGSGSSAQAAATDGTMLTGIPGGKSDPKSTNVKALASKKAQVAQIQSRTTIPKPLARRHLVTPAVKAAPPVNLKQDMRSRGLIK